METPKAFSVFAGLHIDTGGFVIACLKGFVLAGDPLCKPQLNGSFFNGPILPLDCPGFSGSTDHSPKFVAHPGSPEQYLRYVQIETIRPVRPQLIE